MALQPPITDIDYVNTVAISDAWMCALDHKKKVWVIQASTFLVANWDCSAVDLLNPVDSIKYSVALISDLIADGLLYSKIGVNPNSPIKREKSKIGSIECETEYLGSTRSDPLQIIDDVLLGICARKSGGKNDIFLVRV